MWFLFDFLAYFFEDLILNFFSQNLFQKCSNLWEGGGCCIFSESRFLDFYSSVLRYWKKYTVLLYFEKKCTVFLDGDRKLSNNLSVFWYSTKFLIIFDKCDIFKNPCKPPFCILTELIHLCVLLVVKLYYHHNRYMA